MTNKVVLDNQRYENVADIYHTKSVYIDYSQGINWHTPCALFLSNNSYEITKGIKKIAAALLLGIEKIPVVVVHKTDIPAINSDLELLNFLQEVAKSEPVKDPSIGIRFMTFKNSSKAVPTFHFIDINEQVAHRQIWDNLLKFDILKWQAIGRTVWVNHLPKKLSPYFNFQKVEDFDDVERRPKHLWDQNVCAAIKANTADEVEQLVKMLVWFSSDCTGNSTGSALASVDQKIIYREKSNLNLSITEKLLHIT
jgi:hypothetical protein